MNTFRTGLLLAGLTGLFLAIGYLLGGQGGMLLAFLQAPFRFPESIVLASLFEVPSCILLYPNLRSAEASVLFHRPLFTR